ncbi:hypothetical protein ACFW4O_03330 [Streptomyces mutabilis]|uniref:hypothetical protein n=1 Tax=Streptomyces mutabilis TaxID=67332 RepID=UPI003685AF4D
MNWDDHISLWLLGIFDVLGLVILLLLGFIRALRPVISAARRLRHEWSGPQTPDQD